MIRHSGDTRLDPRFWGGKMKRIIMVVLVLVSLCLTACKTHEHSYSEADCIHPSTCIECGETEGDALGHTSLVGVCARCGEIGNKELLTTLNTKFELMMEAGTPLFSCLSGITDLDDSTQYKRFLDADKYIDVMESVYEEINVECMDLEELEPLVYQIMLLRNTCPPNMYENDTTSLENKVVLYQLYLQQLSSSCSYISEILDYLAGDREDVEKTIYFEEIPDMPTPDSIIYGISYYSTKNAPGNIQYTYLLGDNETDATLNYNIYLNAIETNTEMEVDISESVTIVSQNGNMLSVMMAGKDPTIGYYLTISFQV